MNKNFYLTGYSIIQLFSHSAIRLFFVIALLFSLPLKAQVTIGANDLPNPSSMLDIRSNDHYGLLLPSLKLTSTTDSTVLAGGVHVPGMVVYNTETTGDVRPGVYYNDGTKWVKMGERWFYMPSFNLPITATGSFTCDLYKTYKDQFTKAGNTQFVSSNTSVSVTNVQPVYASDQLDYYVTAYSTDCITITGINSAGVMSYTVKSTNVPEGSFINVIFVVK